MAHAIVYVLGPWSQSPRMRNHLDELHSRGYSATYISYDQSKRTVAHVDWTRSPIEPVCAPQWAPAILAILIKVILLTYRSLEALCHVPDFPKIVIVQVLYIFLIDRFLHFSRLFMFLEYIAGLCRAF